jgi:hypothetical protein
VINEYHASPEIRQGAEETSVDLHFRTAAVDALALSSKPRAYLEIVNVLKGTDVLMRCEAARALYRSAYSQLLFDSDVGTYNKRKVAALGDMRVLRALMEVAVSAPPKHASRDEMKLSRETRENVISALRKSGNPEALKFVEKLEKEAANVDRSQNTPQH